MFLICFLLLVLVWVLKMPAKRPPLYEITKETYTTLISCLAENLKAIPDNQQIVLDRPDGGTTNVFRERIGTAQRLDLRGLNAVILAGASGIDVGGSVRFDDLVDYTLRRGFMPLVVPELISITVGGAFSGVAIESSSFRHGLFHETVDEVDVLLADGTCVTTKAGEPLFQALPNSYGTLGYIVRLRIRLIHAPAYISLTRFDFCSPQSFFNHLRQEHQLGVRFLEGIAFSGTRFSVLQGSCCCSGSGPLLDSRSRAFCDVLQSGPPTFLMTPRDYFFRWDSDAFFSTPPFLRYRAVRYLLAGLLSSDSLRWAAKALRLGGGDAGREKIVQDVGLPIAQCVEFFQWVDQCLGMYPIWICPYKDSNRFPLCKCIGKAEDKYLCCDFGLGFGLPGPVRGKDPDHHLKSIENKLIELQGTKGLYSKNCYTEEVFWSHVVDGAGYHEWKSQLDPNGKFYSLWQKVTRY